jgi:tRNA(His) 5'-end guanylyltransferase
MEASLTDRINSYQDLSDYQLMKRLPIVIVLNGRSFSKLSSLVDKPFSPDFMELMIASMVKLCQEVDGVVFAFTFNDQIIVALRNDQTSTTEAWYNNKIQAMVSVSSSLATLEFNKVKDTKDIKLLGDAVFTAKAFVVPSIMELTNTIIHMQQSCFHTALSQACFYELLKRHPADTVKQMLAGKTPKEKSEILYEECKVDFNSYPLPFKRGVGAYRSPKFNPKSKEIKHKLIINDELPLFSHEKDWLFSIFKSGADILRLDNKNGDL